MFWGLVAESKPYFQVMLEQLSGLHVGTGETNSTSHCTPCDSSTLVALANIFQCCVSLFISAGKGWWCLCHGNRTFICLGWAFRRKFPWKMRFATLFCPFCFPGTRGPQPLPGAGPSALHGECWSRGPSQLLGEQKGARPPPSAPGTGAEPRGAGGEEPACVATGSSRLTSGPPGGCLQASAA